MTKTTIRCDGRGRIRGTLRVSGSFFVAVLFGGLLLVPFVGPLGPLTAVGAAIFGLPSLALAILLRAIFDRSIRDRLLAWCLVAPFVAAGAPMIFQYFVDFRLRGFGVADFLVLEQTRMFLAFGLLFASLASLVFYIWERRAARSAHASS